MSSSSSSLSEDEQELLRATYNEIESIVETACENNNTASSITTTISANFSSSPVLSELGLRGSFSLKFQQEQQQQLVKNSSSSNKKIELKSITTSEEIDSIVARSLERFLRNEFSEVLQEQEECSSSLFEIIFETMQRLNNFDPSEANKITSKKKSGSQQQQQKQREPNYNDYYFDDEEFEEFEEYEEEEEDDEEEGDEAFLESFLSGSGEGEECYEDEGEGEGEGKKKAKQTKDADDWKKFFSKQKEMKEKRKKQQEEEEKWQRQQDGEGADELSEGFSHCYQCSPSVCYDPKSKLVRVEVLRMHHIYCRYKKRYIIEKALQCGLQGFALFGLPGAVVVEGDKESVAWYSHAIRSIRTWKSCKSVGTDLDPKQESSSGIKSKNGYSLFPPKFGFRILFQVGEMKNVLQELGGLCCFKFAFPDIKLN